MKKLNLEVIEVDNKTKICSKGEETGIITILATCWDNSEYERKMEYIKNNEKIYIEAINIKDNINDLQENNYKSLELLINDVYKIIGTETVNKYDITISRTSLKDEKRKTLRFFSKDKFPTLRIKYTVSECWKIKECVILAKI